MDANLKALCVEILTDNVGSERFTALLLETGVRLDTVEWDIANRILEKSDEMKNVLGRGCHTVH